MQLLGPQEMVKLPNLSKSTIHMTPIMKTKLKNLNLEGNKHKDDGLSDYKDP